MGSESKKRLANAVGGERASFELAYGQHRIDNAIMQKLFLLPSGPKIPHERSKQEDPKAQLEHHG